jgi:hypothetical protein
MPACRVFSGVRETGGSRQQDQATSATAPLRSKRWPLVRRMHTNTHPHRAARSASARWQLHTRNNHAAGVQAHDQLLC